MHLKHRKKFGFRVNPLHRKREPHAFHYLRQQKSFWIAALSLVAFVTGNMLGQHGWYAFWKSVLGGVDDSLIVYTGTVSPIEMVPDYSKWSQYGGNVDAHTYRQVPQDVFVYLPTYKSSLQREVNILHGRGNDVYSVGYLGSYATGAENSGSHPGADIRAPEGTPVKNIMNGVVSEIKEGGGFGNLIVIRHPNVPDPSNPAKLTTLYSSYAHLSAIYVEKGAIVHKGEHIGDSGSTGYASGPHLHFQIDREDAPWHPYWPFTASEAERENMSFADAVNAGLYKARGYLYTVNPMLYVQANYSPVETTIVREKREEKPEIAKKKPNVFLSVAQRKAQRIAQLLSRREERLRLRLARRAVKVEPDVALVQEPKANDDEIITSTEEVAASTNNPAIIQRMTSGNVASVEIRHDGEYSGRGWEKIVITALDADGNPVANPTMSSDIYLRTAYGDAEYRPSIISPLDFEEGEVSVNMLPRGRRTIVIEVQPFGILSRPMRYNK
ncbi:MAG: M23 family metallopeptidase [Candidatus Peribacteraceae bacterium]|jgi:hypothetical protein|nr:M23 family metallopeptidase [Candidatus Peribacteraceae bacterium]MDP7454033.1 M23 family metallopeptidase [Candidatus Peribacteraceae bacterium]MDP7645920.1 M23 family metallopeptidase [Candidatus Peribacteraceae bacterium]